MTKKIAFFDVDGTLVGDASIPTKKTVDAIHHFQSQGNLALVCTGRSKPEILPEIMEIGFDGIIGAGGGFISIGEDVIHHHTMPEADVRDIIQFFDDHDIAYYIESNSGLFGSQGYSDRISETILAYTNHDLVQAKVLRSESQWFHDLIDSFAGQVIDYADVNKISFINNSFDYQSIVAKFGHKFEIFNMTVPFFGKESGEIAVKGNDKETAITIVLDRLGLSKADAISFGDANNDLAMFRACGYNVAMGNATTELKAAADEVTTDVNHDGIAVSLEANQYFSV